MLPTSVGVALLGDTWQSARALVVPFAAQYTGLAAYMAVFLGLKSFDARNQTVQVRAVFAVATLLLGSLGAALWSSAGAAWGLAAAGWIAAVVAAVYFWQVRADAALPAPGAAA